MIRELPKKTKACQHSFISTHRDAVMDGAEKKRSATLIVPSRRSRGGRRRRGPPRPDESDDIALERKAQEAKEKEAQEQAQREKERKEAEERAKRLAEAEERARLLRIEAERVKQEFLRGFENDVVRFNQEVAKLQAKLNTACRFGQEEQMVTALKKLTKLDTETETVLKELGRLPSGK